jgi:hypothetical protein
MLSNHPTPKANGPRIKPDACLLVSAAVTVIVTGPIPNNDV